MPFQSTKQRKYLQINKPKLYKKWKNTYGTNVTKRKRSGQIRGKK